MSLRTGMMLLLLCIAVHAQVPASAPKSSEKPTTTTGSITGRVVNESGQPLAGTSVFVRTVTSGFTARATTTDADGNFRVNGLERGLYIVSAQAPAYTFPFDPTTPPTYYRIGDSVRL